MATEPPREPGDPINRRQWLNYALGTGAGLLVVGGPILYELWPEDPVSKKQKDIMRAIRKDGLLPEKYFQRSEDKHGFFEYDFLGGVDGKPRDIAGGSMASARAHTHVGHQDGDSVAVLRLNQPKLILGSTYVDEQFRPINEEQARALQKRYDEEADKQPQRPGPFGNTVRIVMQAPVVAAVEGELGVLRSRRIFAYDPIHRDEPFVISLRDARYFDADIVPLNPHVVLDLTHVDLVGAVKARIGQIRGLGDLRTASVADRCRNMLDWRNLHERYDQPKRIDIRLSHAQIEAMNRAEPTKLWMDWVLDSVIWPMSNADNPMVVRFPPPKEIKNGLPIEIQVEGAPPLKLDYLQPLGQKRQALYQWMEQTKNIFKWDEKVIEREGERMIPPPPPMQRPGMLI